MSQSIRFSDLAHFFPKQQEATRTADTHRYFLYGGARGPGKSYWLRWYLLRRLLRHGAAGRRGVRVMLGCEDYPALWERQIEKVRVEFPGWLGRLVTSPVPEFRLRSEYGGGVLAFRNLDDPSKYQSAEFAAIGVDELTKNAESTFDILRGSLRWPGVEDTRFVAASNSNGPGQRWVRRYWIEGDLPSELQRRRGEFAYLPALPGDNPHLPSTYWDELETLSGPLRKSWLLGDWWADLQGLVYDEFDAANVTDDEPVEGLPLEVAYDDGYIDPRVMLIIQRQPTRILVADELYHSRHLAGVCVGEVVELCERRGWARPELAVGSPEAKELQQHFRRADIPCRAEPHRITDGIEVVRRLVKDGHGYRALVVNRRCRNLLREVREGYRYPDGTKQRRDAEQPLDLDNHAVDALRYWCFLRCRRAEPARRAS